MSKWQSCWVISFDSHTIYRTSTTKGWIYFLEKFFLSVKKPNSRITHHFMASPNIKINPCPDNIRRHVRKALTSIYHKKWIFARICKNTLHNIHIQNLASHIGCTSNSKKLYLFDLSFYIVIINRSIRMQIHPENFEFIFFCNNLPRDDIGMMISLTEKNGISLF